MPAKIKASLGELTAVKLKKPPIVEAWVGLHFDPDPDGESWESVSARFLKDHWKNFPQFEVDHDSEISVRHRDHDLPEVLSCACQLTQGGGSLDRSFHTHHHLRHSRSSF